MIRLPHLLLTILLVVSTATGAVAAALCSDTRSADQQPIREADFDLYRAQRNIDWLDSLRAPFAQAIDKSGTRQAVDPGTLPSATTFATSYPNALRQIQGALLKQRAEFAEQSLQLAKAHHRAKEARAAQTSLDDARREFCDYLLASRYRE